MTAILKLEEPVKCEDCGVLMDDDDADFCADCWEKYVHNCLGCGEELYENDGAYCGACWRKNQTEETA